MKRRKLSVLEHNRLDSLSTPRLLARLKRLHQCEESLEKSDRKPDEITSTGSIEFKDSAEWKAEYDYLNKLLAEREHISS
jgi:hypothetical protein